MTDEQKQATRDRIGMRIASLRHAKGWTQAELSARSGLQRTHVSRIEAGKFAVTFESIEAIAQAMGMTVDIIDTRLTGLMKI